MSGFTFTSVKLLLVIVFLWFASPVSSHLIARLEVTTNEDEEPHFRKLDAAANWSRSAGGKKRAGRSGDRGRREAWSVFLLILLGFLVACAISVSLSKNLLNSILIYMSYSLVASVIWILLESPDLAITEAAVGAGITSVLFFVTLEENSRDDGKRRRAEKAGRTGSASTESGKGEESDEPKNS